MSPKDDLLLSVEDLKVFFHSDGKVARAVDGVSYEVREGETVCLVGESGCGKTVSVLAILGLIPRPPGEINEGKIDRIGPCYSWIDPAAPGRDQ
jgi:ABC-type dipeptide/oligopeptide/nickel transport system ATPase component